VARCPARPLVAWLPDSIIAPSWRTPSRFCGQLASASAPATPNLLIFVSDDHGCHLGWRGQWAKHDLSEEVMRAPLIARWPSVTQPVAAEGV